MYLGFSTSQCSGKGVFLFYFLLLSVCAFGQDPNPGACITLGPNLVENPEFDQGNTGFSSTYLFNADYTCDFGQYSVAPTVIHDPVGGASCYNGTGFDLTSIWAASDRNDPGTGNFLLLDPSDTTGGNFAMWQQTIQVCPGSEYVFSAFAKNLYYLEATFPYSGIDPIFDLTINGQAPTQAYFIDGVLSQNGTFDPLPRQSIADSAVWTQISGRWNSGQSTSATITIKNIVPGNQGNDIAIDGIFFGLCNRVIDIAPNTDIAQCPQLSTVAPVTFSIPTQTQAEGWQFYEWYKDGSLIQSDPNPVTFTTPADVNGEYYGTYELRVYDDPQGPANGACGNVSKSISIFEDCPVGFPVELVEFEARTIADQVELAWTTAWESQNRGFEILMGQKNRELSPVALVEGKGTSQVPHAYRFLSNSLIPGIYQFQLKQIDIDGKATFSDVVEVELNPGDATMQLQLVPNPASDAATLTVWMEQAHPVSVDIVSVSGAILATHTQDDELSREMIWELPIASLPEGYYLIRVRGASQRVLPLIVR